MTNEQLPKEIMDSIENEAEQYATDHFARGRQDKHNCKRDYQFAAVYYSLHYFRKIVEKDLKIQELSDKETEAWKFYYAAKKQFDEQIEQLIQKIKSGDTI